MPLPGAVLSGVTSFSAGTSQNALAVGFRLEPLASPGTFIPAGTAQPVAGSNNTAWKLEGWDTASLPNGDYRVHVLGDFSNIGTCHGDTVGVKISNGATTSLQQPKLQVRISPNGWEGSTNVSVSFKGSAVYVDEYGKSFDVTSLANFRWGTTRGSIRADKSAATYYSGPAAGLGAVGMGAEYKGVKAQVQVPVRVHEAAAAAPAPAEPVSTPSPMPSEKEPIAAPGTPVTSYISTDIENCILERIPRPRFVEIRHGRVVSSLEERVMISDCYAHRGIVPARFAPVAPEEVLNLPAAPAEVLSVLPAKGVRRTDGEGHVRRGLKFSGKAEPGKDIFIYIFSEPLVLKAQADKSGNWEYILQNPLKPGKHQVFVTMERVPKEFVRTEPLLIEVARAAESADNPQGGGLELAQSSRQAEIRYALAALLLVLVSIRIVFRMRRKTETAHGL